AGVRDDQAAAHAAEEDQSEAASPEEGRRQEEPLGGGAPGGAIGGRVARVTFRAADVSPDPDLDSHPDSDPPGVRRAAADGAAQLVAWDLKLPQGASRMRQFVFGLWLPVVVARSVLRDARVRARWLRFGGAQVAATVLVAALALWVGGSDGGDDKEVSEATKGAVAELRHRAAPADRALVRAQRSLVNDRLDRLEQRLEGRGERGVPAPDELPAF